MEFLIDFDLLRFYSLYVFILYSMYLKLNSIPCKSLGMTVHTSGFSTFVDTFLLVADCDAWETRDDDAR